MAAVDLRTQRLTIDSLPFEIIYDSFLENFTRDMKQWPIVASHVCRRWREFALDSKVLWTRIKFVNPLDTVWEKQATFVARSGEAPLKIDIGGWAIFRQKSVKVLTSILRIILPHSARWKSLEVHARLPGKLFRLLLDRVRAAGPLSALETLYLHVYELNGVSRGLERIQAPRLRHLNLTDVPVNYSSSIFNDLHTISIRNSRTLTLPQEDTSLLIRHLLTRSPHLQALGYQNISTQTSDWRSIVIR